MKVENCEESEGITNGFGVPLSGNRRQLSSVPGMSHSPLTQGRKRDPFRVLPFRFSAWIPRDCVQLSLPENFGEVNYGNCPSPAKIRFSHTGRVYAVSVGIEGNGSCFMGERIGYFFSSIGAGEGDRLDFTYNGKGKFDVSIGDDTVKTNGERPYTVWEKALEDVRHRLC